MLLLEEDYKQECKRLSDAYMFPNITQRGILMAVPRKLPLQ